MTLAGIAFAFQQMAVAPALPALQRDLDTSLSWTMWLLTGFWLTSAVATPLVGKLGDRYGRSRALVGSLLIFTAGSGGAAVAPDFSTLVLCRMIQGCGAGMFPLSYAIIKDQFPADRVGPGIAAMASVFAIGGGLGLSLSGFIVTELSWRLLFLAGIVPGAVAGFVVHRHVPASPTGAAARLDVAGALLLSLTLTCLLLGLTAGEAWKWSSASIAALFATAAVLGVVWAVVEHHVLDPMVDLAMLGGRTVLLTNVVTLLSTAAVVGAWVLIPAFVAAPSALVDYGFDATMNTTGLYLLPGALAGLATATVGARIGRRHGPRQGLIAGTMVCALSIAMLAIWRGEPWHVLAGTLLLGTGLPLIFSGASHIVIDAVESTATGVAAAMNSVMRQVGGAIGGQAAAALLSAQTYAATGLPKESAFTLAFALAAATAVLATLLAVLGSVTDRREVARPSHARAPSTPSCWDSKA